MNNSFTQFLLLMTVTITLSTNLRAQVDGPIPITAITNETLSQQGTQFLGLENLVGIQINSVSNDGDKIGNSTWYGAQSVYGYNVADKINVNGYLQYDHQGFSPEQGSGSGTTNFFNAGIGAAYILPVGPGNLFIGGKAGGGSNNNKDDTSGSTFENNSDYFSYNLGVKYAHLLNDGHSVAIYANYLDETESFDDGEIGFNGLNLGFGMYNFNTSDRYDVFHNGAGSGYSNDKFSQGDMFIMGSSGLNTKFGTTTYTIESGGQTFSSEDALTQIDLDLCGQYYVSDGFGLQVGLEYGLLKQCDSESDASNSSSLFQINVGAVKHIDAICPAFYGFGEIAVGSQGFTSTSSSGEDNSDSQGVFEFQVGIGDYYFFAPNLALNPELYYANRSVGDLTNSGLNMQVGFVAFLDR